MPLLAKLCSMSRFCALTAILALSPQVARSGKCPAVPDHSEPLNALISQIQAAQNEGAANVIANQMWEFWADAPSEQAQAILDRGMTKRASYDYMGALQEFDALIAYCPDYAEGYNQRAFVNYLRRDFSAALIDLDKALELSPRHVAAMSGRALSLFGLSRMNEARQALKEALSLNPWLPERGLMAPGGPLAPTGTKEIEL